jgi:hypothetical protein
MKTGVEFEVKVGIGKSGRYAKLWSTRSRWSPTAVEIRMERTAGANAIGNPHPETRPYVLKQLAVDSLQQLINKMNDEIERGDYT